MTPRMPREESAARTPRTYSGSRDGGTAPSSMTCMDRSSGCSRAMVVLARWRSSHSIASVRRSIATVTAVAPAAR